VFWCRQLIALSVGLGAGFLALTGIYVIIGFFIALFLVSYLYYSKMLNINEEEFGANELFMEGVGNAFGLFLVRQTHSTLFI
jgi:hypothetical protein